MPCSNFELEMTEFMKLYRALPDRERQIIGARFGFDGTPGLSLGRLGKQLGISNERVRQIEHKCLEKMYAQMKH